MAAHRKLAADFGHQAEAVVRAAHERLKYQQTQVNSVDRASENARDFSVSDRIQFTAPDKALGVANRDLATIESIASDCRISACLVNNRQVDFTPLAMLRPLARSA